MDIFTQVYNLLIENTGTHFLDSGGANGRNWQRNQKLSIEDFKKRPEATLEISIHEFQNGEQRVYATPTVDLFHYLTSNLNLDSVCNEFNSKEVDDWNSQEFYGVSLEGEAFILEHFDAKGDSFNSANWESNFSQIVQGIELEHKDSGDSYILLQIHGGCDIRGGYTDAKLFKLDVFCDYFLDDACYFEYVDWCGEFINHEGSSVSDDEWVKIAMKLGVTKNKEVTIEGSIGR